jgi:hypothetical protein
MFCPKCGSNQSEGRKFCTVCGTNLYLVSQALTGQLNQAPHYTPAPAPNQVELERQREVAKGMRMAIIGGGIVAFKLFSFIFSGPWRGGSPLGFWSFIGFILLAIGISKIISHREHDRTPGQAPINLRPSNLQPAPPQPVFSTPSAHASITPDTGELEVVRQPIPSVTEDDTQHLPHYTPPREVQK